MTTRILVRISLFLIVALVPSLVTALPGWVKDAVKSAETSLVEEDADVLILYSTKECEIQKSGASESLIRFVVKILNNDGNHYAVLSAYSSDLVSVDKIKGWRVRGDGKIENMPSESVIEIGRFEGTGYYDDMFETRAGFRHAEPGDIIAFQYRERIKNDWTSLSQSFAFQVDQPVVFARFELTIPDKWNFHSTGTCLEPVSYTQDGNTHVWEASSLSFRGSEVHMPDWGEVARYVRIQCYGPEGTPGSFSRNWASVAEWMIAQMPLTSTDDPAIKTLVDSLVSNRLTMIDSVKAIAEFAQGAIRYVAIEIGDGRFQPRPANSILANRYGDCKDKTALMRTMLDQIDVPSYPVLAASGKLTDSTYASPFQFNHCIIALPKSALGETVPSDWWTQDDWLYFDPTDPSLSLGLLPHYLRNTMILPGVPGVQSPVMLQNYHPEDRYVSMYAEAILNDDGTTEAMVRIVYRRLIAEEMQYRLSRLTEKEKITRYCDLFKNQLQTLNVSNLLIAEVGNSLVVSFDLTGAGALTRAGDVTLLKMDLFTPDWSGLRESSDRQFPITLGGARISKTETVWRLPKDWNVIERIEPQEVKCRLVHLKSTVDLSDSTIGMAVESSFFGGQEEAGEYTKIMEFMSSYRRIANARALLKEN